MSSPVVVVPFGTTAAERTEIAPAYFIDTDNGYEVFGIPDGSGGWMKSSPNAHNSYVHAVNQKLGGKVKPLVRFIKAWKYYQSVPISSFYLELQTARYANGETSIVYDIDVKNVLIALAGLADMNDPMGVSGRIPACSTEVKKTEAESKLATAISRAKKARDAENNQDTKVSFDWWDKLYDTLFPSYYR